MKHVGAILLTIALTGCMAPTESVDDNAAPPPHLPEDPPPFPHRYNLDTCHGFVTGLDWIGENDRFNPPPHPDWQPPITDDGPYVTGIFNYGLECQRFHFNDFERPLRVFVESAGVDTVPEDCAEHGDWDVAIWSGDAMETLIINDQEVVDYLRDTYGMPVHYADIETEMVSDAPFDRYVWTMTHDHGGVSRFETLVDDAVGEAMNNIRMFWWNETTLGYLEWGIRDVTHQRLYTTGHAEPPLAIAEWHTEFVGDSNYMTNVQVTGRIQLFHDLICKEPA